MSMLHGAWVDGQFFLWGEVWRRSNAAMLAVQEYPFAMTVAEMEELLGQQGIAIKGLEAGMRAIALPTRVCDTGYEPLLSSGAIGEGIALFPWRVAGAALEIKDAIGLLGSVPLADLGPVGWLGADLRFWSHLVRWGWDLLARGKYLPGLVGERAAWRVLLDSAIDQERLNRFAKQMPTICRLYGPVFEHNAMPRPQVAKALIVDFLSQFVDVQIRQLGLKPKIASSLQPWLLGLATGKAGLSSALVDRLQPVLSAWLGPVLQIVDQFRVGLMLQPPLDQTVDARWKLLFGLQSIEDGTQIIPAAVIWQNPVDRLAVAGQVIDRPQETLLAGLGVASRIYPVLEASLAVGMPTECWLGPEQVYDFLREQMGRLRDGGVGVILPPSLANREGWANRLGLKVRATTTDLSLRQRGMQGILNFEWELAIGGHSLSKREFDRLVALNTPLVEINGEWVELRPQDVRSANNFFAARKEQTQLTLEDALRLSSGDTQTMEKLPVVSFEASGALQELVVNLADSGGIAPVHPAGLVGELRPYQARGVGWLAFLERWGLGGCLADDMGLGKTLQLIAFVLHLRQEGRLERPILIVCPTSVLGNWEREIRRFAPELGVLVQHGEKRSQGKALARSVAKCDLVLTSYALVQRDLSSLKLIEWQVLVLDEAQNIKNSETKQTQAVRELGADFRVALTGTPVENRLLELWSIMDFLNPGYLGAKNYFQRRFVVPIERYGDRTSLEALRSLAQPFILRRLKTDRSIIQDLPEKNEMTAFCGLTVAQADRYQQILDETLGEIDAATGIQRKGLVLGLLMRLKQVCNHADLIGDKLTLSETFEEKSGKLQRLVEMLEEVVAAGDRALIFTQFAEWGKLLQGYLVGRLGREVLFLYGGTPKVKREEMVERFQADPQAPSVFILSLKAGGVGLNLTRANHVFHFDRWWNPAVENQATDRVFRIGQVRNVQVHKFVCTGTLEERIHEMIEGKKALAEQVIGTGEGWLGDLDTERLRELLVLDRGAILGDG
ncbi:MAG: hypothetical protein RLZZ511_4249 [Cyanobacteriota bacterium]